MRRRATCTAVAAALLLLPGTAVAGAPNYDCAVGDHGRLAIDQWQSVVGHCLTILGSHVLRRSDSGGLTLRDGPSRHAKPVLPIPVGSAVWESPDLARGGWVPLNMFVVRGGSLFTRSGWLRQRTASITP
jgi:hypothetical protein